jgi:hypothetical protein
VMKEDADLRERWRLEFEGKKINRELYNPLGEPNITDTVKIGRL